MCVVCTCAGQSQPASQPAQPLKLLQTIDLPGVKGRIDHMAWDSRRNRLCIAARGNDTLEIVDLTAGKPIGPGIPMPKPQSVAYLLALDNLAISVEGEGSCRLYQAESMQLRLTAKGMDGADNIRADPNSHAVYTAYSRGAKGWLAVTDARDATSIGNITLAGAPEAFQLESNGPRIFVNEPDLQIVEVVDRVQRKSIARWSLTDASSNFPMALDEPHKRLFIGCRSPAKLLVLDTDTGKTIASLNCDGDCDDLYYDSDNSLIYASCGKGMVDVFRQNNLDSYERIAQVSTASGARTSMFVSSQRRLYVVAPMSADGKTAARVMVYDTPLN